LEEWLTKMFNSKEVIFLTIGFLTVLSVAALIYCLSLSGFSENATEAVAIGIGVSLITSLDMGK